MGLIYANPLICPLPRLWLCFRLACGGGVGRAGLWLSTNVTCTGDAGGDVLDVTSDRVGVPGRVVYPGASSTGVRIADDRSDGVGDPERGVSGGGRLSSSMMRSSGRDAVGD